MEDLDINVSNQAIKQIANLAKLQQMLEKEVEDTEEALKRKQEELRKVQEDLLPTAMAEAGMKSFTLDNGAKITIKDDIAASIPKDRTMEAYGWLRDNGFGDIIKNTVSVDFNKEEDDQASALLDYCREHMYPATNKQSVHASTLKAFLKEQMAHGVDVPLDLFGAFPYSKAVIK